MLTRLKALLFGTSTCSQEDDTQGVNQSSINSKVITKKEKQKNRKEALIFPRLLKWFIHVSWT